METWRPRFSWILIFREKNMASNETPTKGIAMSIIFMLALLALFVMIVRFVYEDILS
jgi:hypothetical protein